LFVSQIPTDSEKSVRLELFYCQNRARTIFLMPIVQHVKAGDYSIGEGKIRSSLLEYKPRFIKSHLRPRFKISIPTRRLALFFFPPTIDPWRNFLMNGPYDNFLMNGPYDNYLMNGPYDNFLFALCCMYYCCFSLI
jgi:hypothetical protein